MILSMIFPKDIHSTIPLSFLVQNRATVSFVLPLVFLTSLHLLRSYNVSSYTYHYLLVYTDTFISLSLLVSISSDRYEDGGNNDRNLPIFAGVKGFGNTQ
jgi:hypothetical protein